MANKNQSPETGPEGTQQPEKKSQELFEIGELRKQHNIGRTIHAGVCAANGWKPGKAITREDFLTAVAQFTGAPVDGKLRGTNREREAKK